MISVVFHSPRTCVGPHSAGRRLDELGAEDGAVSHEVTRPHFRDTCGQNGHRPRGLALHAAATATGTSSPCNPKAPRESDRDSVTENAFNGAAPPAPAQRGVRAGDAEVSVRSSTSPALLPRVRPARPPSR